MTEITSSNVPRAVTAKKTNKSYGSCRLMVVHISVKFDENISVFKLPSGHELKMTVITICTVQR